MNASWACVLVLCGMAVGCGGSDSGSHDSAGGKSGSDEQRDDTETRAGAGGTDEVHAAGGGGNHFAAGSGGRGGVGAKRDAVSAAGTPSTAGNTGNTGNDASSAGAGGADATPGAPRADAARPTVSDKIEGVAFDQSTGSRVEPIPVLLYSGGYASYNANLIVKPIDIAYDVVEHPDAWPAWRRGPDRVELNKAGGWTEVHYAYECKALPKGTTFAGTFERYVENIADPSLGGNVHRYRIRFAQDGTFEYCDATEVIVVVTGTIDNTAEPKKGTYQVDGLTVHLKWSDGTAEDIPLFYDPTRPTRVWLGRAFYENPKTQNAAICVKP